MTRRLIGAMLIAATALTPMAAQAQDGGFGGRVMREARQSGPSGEAPRSRPDRAAPAPRAQRQPDTQASPASQPQRQQWQGRNDGGQQSVRTDGGGNRWQGRQAQRDAGQAGAQQQQSWRNSGNTGNRWQGQSQRNTDGAGTPNWRDRGTTTANRPTPGQTGNGRVQGDQNSRYDNRNNGGFGQQVLRDARRADQGRYDRNDGRYDNGRNNSGRYDNRRYDDSRYGNRYSNNRYNNGRNDDRRWSTGWRNDRRYDWQSYRTRNVNVYRAGRYYSPYNNWSYRRLSIGFSLWPLFYSNQYWINDPWQYRLPEVYGPYRWVRYYDDALLVDVYSGEVVDVIYDFFW